MVFDSTADGWMLLYWQITTKTNSNKTKVKKREEETTKLQRGKSETRYYKATDVESTLIHNLLLFVSLHFPFPNIFRLSSCNKKSSSLSEMQWLSGMPLLSRIRIHDAIRFSSGSVGFTLSLFA